ncbi:MAG: metallophosphatase family protein [Actinomycetota bacterium]|nr:metallophosphatase family protein [Actinomycetota bacterium]
MDSRWSQELRVVVLADTHLRTPRPGSPSTAKRLPEAAWSRLTGADAILHAGDVLDVGVLDSLRAIAPVYAVLGNNDLSLGGVLPEVLVVDLGGIRIGMIHDSGPSTGRSARMRRRFPDTDVVVFGHSHAPMNEIGVDGQLLFNPGSATQRRAQPVHTLGELRMSGGALIDHRIIALDGSHGTF